MDMPLTYKLLFAAAVQATRQLFAVDQSCIAGARNVLAAVSARVEVLAIVSTISGLRETTSKR